MPKIPLTFRIFRGDDLIRTETLTQSPIKIGKLSSSHLRLEDDESVSRMHAVIEVTSGNDITIIDLGSTKGTIVNGKKINKASLQDGDIILLGDTKIVLSIGDAEVAATPGESVEEHTAVSEAPKVASPVPAPPPAHAPPAHAPPPPVLPPAAAARPHAPPPPPAPAPPPVNVPPPARMMVPTASPLATASTVAEQAHFGGDASADLHGRRAIEVAAMLTDSVVAVKHLTNPRTGKISTMTWGLFGVGTVSLLFAAGTFLKGVSVASDNKEAYHQWVDV